MYTLQTKVIESGAVTIPEFHLLRRMPPSEAATWIGLNKPNLDPIEVADLISAVTDSYNRTQNTVTIHTIERFPNRPQFVAAAWLAGASWGQLSCMFGVARATLLRSIERVLPAYGRQNQRYNTKITYTHLSLMREKFLEMLRMAPEGTTNIPVKVLAGIFATLNPHDQPGEYATGEDIQNRISGQDGLTT